MCSVQQTASLRAVAHKGSLGSVCIFGAEVSAKVLEINMKAMKWILLIYSAPGKKKKECGLTQHFIQRVCVLCLQDGL